MLLEFPYYAQLCFKTTWQVLEILPTIEHEVTRLYSTRVIGNNHDGKVNGDYLLAAIVVSVPYLPEAKTI